jgi:predicted HAD superfamily Cof-like phosphohydrolase
VSNIFQTIKDFNQFYGLPCPDKPTLLEVGNPVSRILGFAKTLRDEIDEGADIVAKIHDGADDLEVLTDLADWLNDIVVYALSEAAKYGIPSEQVLATIMDSNFSKKQADGSVLKDEHGKVLKGPAYWKPEPKIKELLKEKING